jgi:hypothetical protein
MVAEIASLTTQKPFARYSVERGSLTAWSAELLQQEGRGLTKEEGGGGERTSLPEFARLSFVAEDEILLSLSFEQLQRQKTKMDWRDGGTCC